MFAGRLLGPEAARGVVSGVVFENCRVDASIFVASCVGRMVDVLASGADEGRGRLR